jgi:DNA-binding NarL/FixJ family response regulator
MIKVAVTDDQPIILSGLQKILSGIADISITACYMSGDALLKGLATDQPDILLLDIQMPGKNGIELAGLIAERYPTVKIIALTNVDLIVQVKKMLKQGCMGYLLKDTSADTLVQAIRTVYGGEQFLYENLRKQLINNLFTPKSSAPVITRREKEILQLITEEMTNQEIADKLFLSLRTVENHRNNLLQKLKVKNTAGLVKVAILEGLV